MNGASAAPVVFVHIGASLPPYALAAYQRASRLWSGPVHALISRSATPSVRVKNLSFTSLEDFYDPSRFASSWGEHSPRDDFRNGFLKKCLERFFVLDQFAEKAGISSFLHAESDVALFAENGLCSRLDKLGRGLFVPRDDVDRAIASVIYVNALSSLRAFISFMSQPHQFENEMQGLAAFIDSEPEIAFSLPTVRQWETPKPTWKSLDPRATGAVFDAAGVGQWVAGIDPRNSPLPIWNHFQNERHNGDFSGFRLEFSPRENVMSIRTGPTSIRFPMANLHVHSKRVRVFKSDALIAFLARASNLPFSIPLEMTPRKWAVLVYLLGRRIAGKKFRDLKIKKAKL